MNATWIVEAVETIKNGIADKVVKDDVTVYKVGSIIRVDIKA